MDETKPEDKQVPTPEPTTAPMTGQISSQMPKRTKARLVAQTAIIVILILGIAGAVWYWFNVYQKPAPAVVEEIKTEEPQTPEPVTVDSKYYVYSYGGDGKYFAFDINPETGKLTEVFKTPGQYQQIVGITDDAAYYLNNGVNSQGNPNEIIKHDFTTKKETVIATTDLKSSYIVSSKLSSDNKRMAYAEVCQTKCSDQDNEKVTTIKQINLADNSIKTLYTKKIYDNSFPFGISGWENLDYLKLFGYCECDGEVSANSTKVLNVNSGDITEINLAEDRVSYVSLSPDSKKIAYVYFSGTYENPKFTSGFKIKDLETGKIETIVESNKEAYESVKWINANQLALFTIKVTSVDAGLGNGGYPTGPRAISLFNYGDANKELKNVTDYAEYMLLDKVTEDYIFYTIITNSKPSQTPTNHALNLKTGKVTKLIIPANQQLSF